MVGCLLRRRYLGLRVFHRHTRSRRDLQSLSLAVATSTAKSHKFCHHMRRPVYARFDDPYFAMRASAVLDIRDKCFYYYCHMI